MLIENPFPTLETERLILRPMQQADLDFAFRHFSDPQVINICLMNRILHLRKSAKSVLSVFNKSCKTLSSSSASSSSAWGSNICPPSPKRRATCFDCQ